MSAGPPPSGPDQPGRDPDVRRSPSGRIPQWAIDEAVGLPPQRPSAWRDHSPAGAYAPQGPMRGGPQPKPRRFRLLLVLATIAAITVGTWFYSGQALLPGVEFNSSGQNPGSAIGGFDEPGSGGTTFSVDPPNPGNEASSVPLGTPAPLAEESVAYRFMNVPAGGQDFVAYDPCRPVHYVIRAEHMPADGQRMITEAVERVSAATGLQFVYDGLSEEAPSDRRPLVQEDRYGDRWAPILISWVTPEEEPEVDGETIGLGGSSFVSVSGSAAVYVSGSMMLDGPQISTLLKFPGGYEQARAIVKHELGHVVGLAHIDDQSQLMYAESNLEVTDFAPGDLTGLAELGRGACVPEL